MQDSKNIKLPNNKSFGFLFFAIFLILSFFFETYKILFLILSFIILIIALTKPSILNKPNLYWFKFGIILSKIFSPIILTLIYLLVFIPFGLINKMFNKEIKNIVNKKYDKKNNSYWTSFDEVKINFDDQY